MERTPRSLGLPSTLEVAGFNVAGALAVETYDRLVPEAWASAAHLPGARRAIVLGCGGRALGRAVLRKAGLASGPAPVEALDPVDRFATATVDAACATLERSGGRSVALHAFETRGGEHADFVSLARRAGLGAPSRLGLLLHPRFGPWLSIRTVLLTRLSGPTTPPLPDFDPCSGCPAPCQTACPVSAPREGGFDLGACGRFRRESPSCAASCAARRACPVGAVHAYAPTVERHHMAAAAAWRAAPDDETAGG